MDSLFRLTDLETRFPLNMNVLDAGRTPRVMGLGEVLREWLKHQIDVLVRRAKHRLDKIAARIELLDGYIIAYLNLDRVIEIIRTEDEPKDVMMAEFSLTDRQAEAILNMRLRSLRKLEEMELRREHAELLKEREELEKLVESPARQRTRSSAISPRSAQALCARNRDRPPPYPGGGGRPGARNPAGGDDRAGADHRHPLATRLDQGDEGACRSRFRRDGEVQGGRWPALRLPCADDGQAPARLRRMVVSIRSARTSCRAGAVLASRCA
jgi:hypothetical protein